MSDEKCRRCNGRGTLLRCRGCGTLYCYVHKYSDCGNARCEGERSDTVPCPECCVTDPTPPGVPVTDAEADTAVLRRVFNTASEKYPHHLAGFLSKQGEAAFQAWWGQFYEAIRDTTAGLRLLAELARLREQVAALAGALEPFAAVKLTIDEYVPDDAQTELLVCGWGETQPGPTVGELRTAARVLAAYRAGGGM